MGEVVTFYRFVRLDGLPRWRARLEERAAAVDLRGTILIAEEGINATLAGSRHALDAFTDWLTALPPFAGIEPGYSRAGHALPVFHRLKVRIRREIVTLGRPDIDPARRTGQHVDASTWNRLLDDPGVLVLDTRNRYEVRVGTFPGAVDPGTRTFREFPAFVAQRLDPARELRVAMFCTGGVRCEKASAYLLERGFETVYQLDGGVLGYLDTVAAADNRWLGECFVFDRRVSVDDALDEGSYEQCFACRAALSAADRASPAYEHAVSCPHCVETRSELQREAFRERRRQVALAAARGGTHVGTAFVQRD